MHLKVLYIPYILGCLFSILCCAHLSIGGYTACGIPLVRSANRNGNGIRVNGISFNGIPFPFISVKKNLTSSLISVNVKEFWGGGSVNSVNR